MKLTSFLAALCILAALAAATASATVVPLEPTAQAAGPAYRMVVLTDTSMGNYYPQGINNAGNVVGYFNNATVYNHAFLYSDGQMHDLGTLGGKYSWAHSVNDLGAVVGFASTAAGEPRAFLYSGGQMQDFLGAWGGGNGEALDINNSGQIVGYAAGPSTPQHAFLYDHGQITDLNDVGHFLFSGATAINDAGEVVGVGWTTEGTRGFLYADGAMTLLGSYPPDVFPSDDVRDINASGRIFGVFGGVGGFYENGLFQPINPLTFDVAGPKACNDRGDAVGALFSDPVGAFPGQSSLFLYHDGLTWDLQSLLPANSPYLQAVSGINNDGVIVGQIEGPGFVTQTVLLQPIPEPATATLALLAGGAAGIAVLRRRRTQND